MNSTLMALGQFIFGLQTLAYEELKRSNSWRHPSNSRVGARAARQFVGVGDDTITLSGWVAPELTGTYYSVAELRAMGDIGKPYALVSGSGEVFGQYVIESLNETGTLHYQDGTPRRIAFDLQLTRVDNDLGGERITVDEQGQFSGDQTQPSTARRRPTLDDLL
ncbi:phage tail protein [Comamonas suwonensis]|nr:phage tail protein [Comamonas suwonensis]